jgi:alpha-tubulin suppressor-like RCC1 family protein
VLCWGQGAQGQLGQGSYVGNIGDNEAITTYSPISVGGTVVQLAAGYVHTCALLDTGGVRCWGLGSFGRLGYGNTNTIGDNETPASAGDVPLGGTAVRIAAYNDRTCAVLDTGAVRCWGADTGHALGYPGGVEHIGDDELPSSAGDVNVGATAVEVSAGGDGTCAMLSSGAIRCWGYGGRGQLGYGNSSTIGDDETPASVGNVP